MDPQSWAQVRDIFQHLTDKSPSHRRDYLDMVCEGAPEVRTEVEALLEAHDGLGDEAPIPGTAPDQPEQVNDYQLEAPIGSGGMGAVYRASHPEHGTVALKLVPEYAVAAERARARFEREAGILRGHPHPALCAIYEHFVADGYAGIAMELIEGQELRNLMPVIPERAIKIIRQLAQALAPLHAQGVIHRDLKPGNVLVANTGGIKLIDFGIAKFADEKLTQTGQILGTPSYMSPEQWQGAPMDARSDLWALGCLLYELIVGEPAFAGEDMMATAQLVIKEPHPTLDADAPEPIANGVEKLVDRLLTKAPEERLVSCEELIGELEAIPA